MNDSLSESRYERKYSIPTSMVDEIAWKVKYHPANFRNTYPKRYVNSLYWDTSTLLFAQQSLEGTPRRIKIRHRWYGDLTPVRSPQFEIKAKNGYLISKNIFKVKKSITHPITTLNQLKSLPNTYANYHTLISSLKPTLLVRYLRQYFTTSSRVRLTIDTQFSTAKIIHPQKLARFSFQTHPFAIIELKYAPSQELIARSIMQSLPLQLSRHSKYLMGIAPEHILIYTSYNYGYII